MLIGGTAVTTTAAELNTLDAVTAGTVAASKAVVVDSNKDIGTFRNITIDGTFSDGNYTFDTSGNVSGLGTIGSGAITATDTTAPLILKYDAGEYVTHAVSSAGVYSIATTDASSDSGAITLDTVDSITLDSDTASEGIVYADGGTNLLRVSNSSSDVIFKPLVDAKDIVFQQYDGNEVCRIADNRRLYFYDEGGEYISSSGSALTIASGSAAWELPAADGSDGQVLKTDGSGNLDWVTQTSGATLSGSTDNTVVTVTGSNAMQGEANLTFDGSTLLVGTSIGATADSNTTIGFPGSDVITFSTGGTEALRINDEGVLGIKTTPTSGWLTSQGVLQIGTGAIWTNDHDETAANKLFVVGNNTYVDSGGNWKAVIEDEGSRFYQQGGAFYFDSAASVSAGANQTFSTKLSISAAGELTAANKLTLSNTTHGADTLLRFDAEDDSGNSRSAEVQFDPDAQSLAITNTAGTDYLTVLTTSGNVGIGTASPDGPLHVHSGASGVVTASAHYDEITIENSGNVGISLLCPRNYYGGIAFGDGTDGDSDNDNGSILYLQSATASARHMHFRVDDAERMRITNGGNLFIGDTANGKMTQGLTIQQGTNDNEILALKSSTDVAQDCTDVAEADTYGTLTKYYATAGGLQVTGFVDSGAQAALSLQGVTSHASPQSGKTSANNGTVNISAYKVSSNDRAQLSADENILSIYGASATRFIFDCDGDAYADSQWTTFDDHDDLAMLHDIEATMIPDLFGKCMKYDAPYLEKVGIIGEGSIRQENGKTRAMINTNRLQMLHHGAIRQVHQQLQDAKEFYEDKIAALEARLLRLEA